MLICKRCKKKFKLKYRYGKEYLKKRLYCSRDCFRKDVANNPTVFKKGHVSFLDQCGKKNCQWRGEKVGYSGLHKWVRKELGSAQVCSRCGKTKQEGRIEWANKNHLYKRKLTEWISVCCKCHAKYDKENNGCERGGNRYS